MGKHVYRIGERVLIVGLMPGVKFNGEVISSDPPRAKVTDRDPIWHGCKVESTHIRKGLWTKREGARG